MVSKYWKESVKLYLLLFCGEVVVVSDNKDGLRSRAYKVIEELLLLLLSFIDDGMIFRATGKTSK